MSQKKLETTNGEKKNLLLCGRPIKLIDRYSMLLDSMLLIFIRIRHSFDGGHRNGIQPKSNASRKMISSRKIDAKMAPQQIFRVFRAARYHRRYR